MQTLTMAELDQLEGGDFWGGVKCGLGLAGIVAGVATVNPVIGLVALGTVVTCVSAFG